MKKVYLCAPSVALLLNIQIAQANPDSYNILAKGDAYVIFEVERSHSSNTFQTAGSLGNQSQDSIFEVISLSYGLGDSWQVGLDLNNNNSISDVLRDYNKGKSSLNTKIQNRHLESGLWAKYGFVGDKNSTFSLAGEFKIVPDIMTNTTGSVIGSLIGGWNFGDGLSVSTTYSGLIPQDPNNSKINTISVDAYKAITGNFTLNPDVYYSKIEANDVRNTTQQYGAGLTAKLNFGLNSYIQSSASAFQTAPQDSLDGKSHWGKVYGRTLSVLLYHLF